MSEDRQSLLEHYRNMRADILGAIEGLSDAAMTDPTLDGWSVKDHLAHLALWDEVRAAEVRRISAGHASAWQMTDEQADAFNEMSYQQRRNISLDQVRWELENTRQQLLDAITAATDRGLDGSLFGEASLRSSHEAEHAGWIRRWRAERGL